MVQENRLVADSGVFVSLLAVLGAARQSEDGLELALEVKLEPVRVDRSVQVDGQGWDAQDGPAAYIQW